MSHRSSWLAAFLFACSSEPAPPPGEPSPGSAARPPDILLITLDTTRQDRIGAYGFGLARTPTIDRLAREGARFDDHATVAPITLPAHISILTGLTPASHGVRDNGAYALSDEVTTLAEHLSAQGYDTAAFVSAVVLDQRYNLDQGFDTYDDDLWAEDAPATFFIRDRPARRTTDRVLAWMQERAASSDPDPAFAWVHYFDPHQPYEVDVEAAGDVFTLPSAYDAELAAVDTAIGRLVAALESRGQLDQTLLVVTADHGESLGDHGEKTHAVFIYDATIKVPLVLRYPPAVPAGRVVAEGTSAVDLAPTLLGLAGLPPLPPTDGLDLSESLRAGTAVPSHPAVIESLLSERGFGMAPLVGLRQDGVKYIRAPRPERYDLRADPGELKNLHEADPAPSASLETRLGTLLAASAARGIHSTANPMDGATREMLLAMGYLAPDTERQDVHGLDPKDGMPLLLQLEQARHAIRAGQHDHARAALRSLVERAPRNVTAWNLLGYSFAREQRDAEALDAYARALAIDPRQHRTLGHMGALHLRQQEHAQARALFLRALEITPGYVEAMVSLSVLESAAGDDAAAETWAQRALDADPRFARAHARLAELRFREGQWAEARAHYEAVLQTTPTHFTSRVQAGLSARSMGDLAAARAHLAAAAELRPDSWVPPYNQACLEAAEGDLPSAMAALQRAAARGLDRPSLLASDPDLAPLRAQPDFALVQRDVQARSTQHRPPR
jgi:arylsulfatase A-like enzyme/predicted TPR repeat methyltransferase